MIYVCKDCKKEVPSLFLTGRCSDCELSIERERSARLQIELGEIEDAFAPVRDWYDKPDKRKSLPDLIAQAIVDLQEDRKNILLRLKKS